MEDVVKLRLYVAGNSPGSRRARTNLAAWRHAHEQLSLEVEVIDVFEAPQRALADGVLLTPQLILHGPSGRSAIVGDLADAGLLSEALQPHGRIA